MQFSSGITSSIKNGFHCSCFRAVGVFSMLVSSKVGCSPNSVFTRHWLQSVIPHPLLHSVVPGLDTGFWFLEGYSRSVSADRLQSGGCPSLKTI